MGLFNHILAGQKIDEWASNYTLIAARRLNQVAATLMVRAEEQIAEIRLKDSLFAQTAFIQERIAPMVRTDAERIAIETVDEANAALLELVEERAVWVQGPAQSEGPEGAFEGAKDIAPAAVPLVTGAVAIGALPFVAVTTTTAWFGLVTTTVIIWPVAVGGGTLAALCLATGAFNTAKIRERTLVRLRNRVRNFIVGSLIKGDEQSPAILQQLADEFDRAAKRAKAR